MRLSRSAGAARLRAEVRRLGRCSEAKCARDGRISGERHVRSILIVIVRVGPDQSQQMAVLAKYALNPSFLGPVEQGGIRGVQGDETSS
jgi:hypothetical protein